MGKARWCVVVNQVNGVVVTLNRKDFRHGRFIFDSLKPMAWALLVVSVSWQMADGRWQISSVLWTG